MRREVPSFEWGHDLSPETVAALVDLADACNDAEFSYAEARLTEVRVQTALETHTRDLDPGPPHRAWVGERSYSIVVDYTEDALRLYLAAAAKLAVAAAAQLKARVEDRPAPQVAVDDIRGSHIYADPALVPSICPDDLERRQDLLRNHARIHTAVRLLHPEHGILADLAMDPEDAQRPVTYSIMEYGALDLAEALHDYGGSCLWLLALLTRSTARLDAVNN